MGTTLVQIGDRNIYLGGRSAGDAEAHDEHFERVVSLTVSSVSLTTDHHPLRDGPGNDYEDFARAVDVAREAVGQPGAVLIHCAVGVSRSATITATTIAAEENRSLDDVVDELKEYRSVIAPHPALRALAREYLGEPIPDDEREACEENPPSLSKGGQSDGDRPPS